MQQQGIRGFDLASWRCQSAAAQIVLAKALKEIARYSVPTFTGQPRADLDSQDLALGELFCEGGNGKVFFGTLRGEDVAVKAPLRGQGRELLKELHVLKHCGPHPNLVHLCGLATDADLGWLLVLGWEDGSLFDQLHQRADPWQLGDTIRVGAGIAAGLECLHDHDVAHLDLKSPNVLLSAQGVPKLCDFGHCVVSRQDRRIAVIGTPHWAAPEVLGLGVAGQAADIWSLGVLLWEMAHRRLPFHGLSYGQVMCVVTHTARPLPLIDANPEVARVIAACLARAPARPSAAAARRELDGLLATAQCAAADELALFFGSRSPCATSSDDGSSHESPDTSSDGWRGALPSCFAGVASLW